MDQAKTLKRLVALALICADLIASSQPALAQLAEVAVAPAGSAVSGVAGSVGIAAVTPTTALPASVSALPGSLGSMSAAQLVPLGMAAAAPAAASKSLELAPAAAPTRGAVTSAKAASANSVPLSPVSIETRETAPNNGASAGSVAVARPISPEAPAPRAIISEAARNGEKRGHPGVLATLKGLVTPSASSLTQAYDGAAPAAQPAPEAAPATPADIDGSKVRIFLTRNGADPVGVDLASLPQTLASDPDFVKALNKAGRVRMVVNDERPGALSRAQAEGLRKALQAAGVTATLDVEAVPIDWARKEAAAAEAGKPAVAEAPKSKIIRILTAPFREAAYIGRTFKAAITKPTRAEIIGGIVSKGPAFIMAAIWWGLMFLPASQVKFAGAPSLGMMASAFMQVLTAPWAHPVAFAAAIAFTLALQVFHGIWINTWQNFQNIIGKQRGINYQTFFNLGYMQLTSAISRIIAWTAIAGTVAPWMLQYWKDMGPMVLLGTFFGTLGYFGVNTLYNRGNIKRGARSGIQQVRDLFFLVAGTFFASGSMPVFWTLFILQQSLDLGLYIISRRAKHRPILYAADADIAATPEFQGMYPVKPGPEVSPLKEALNAVLNNPLFKPFKRGVTH